MTNENYLLRPLSRHDHLNTIPSQNKANVEADDDQRPLSLYEYNMLQVKLSQNPENIEGAKQAFSLTDREPTHNELLHYFAESGQAKTFADANSHRLIRKAS